MGVIASLHIFFIVAVSAEACHHVRGILLMVLRKFPDNESQR